MPEKELIRLIAVDRFLNLTINKKHELQGIVDLAASLYAIPFSVIELVDHEHPYTNKKAAGKFTQAVRKDAFYQRLLNQKKLRFMANTNASKQHLNIGGRMIQFCVTVPLTTHDDHQVGSLLLMDDAPRAFSREQKRTLNILAKQIVQLLEFDFSLDIVKEQFLKAKDAEIKLRSFFESSGACHLLIGKQMEILTFNKNMAEFIESMHSVKLYQGITVDKILRERYLEDFIVDYKRALNGIKVAYERKVTYNTKEIWWYVTFEPGYNADFEIIGISYNATDITERKQQEEKILNQNESLKTIAHVQSHDMRKPVASILGFMNLFKSENYKSTSEELMLMEKVVDELDATIKEIVKISSLDD